MRLRYIDVRPTQRRRVDHDPTLLHFSKFLAIGLCSALVACGGNDKNDDPILKSVRIDTACSFTSIGQTLSLIAVAEDTDGNTVSSGTVTLIWTSSDPNVVSLSGNVATAVADGTATVTVEVEGKSNIVATTHCTVAQVATQLGFGNQPAANRAEEPLSTQPTVEAQDALGNVVSGYTGTVDIAMGANPSGATLGGTTSVSTVSGVASFTDLSIDKAGGGYTLAASATDLSGATSDAFSVDVNVAVVNVEPTAVTLVSLGEQATLIATALSPTNVEQLGVPFSWSSSDESAAAVSSDGVVTAIGNGPATITATAEGVDGTSTVTVAQVAVAITVSPEFKVLAVAEILSPALSATDALGNDIPSAAFQLTSRDPAVASIAAETVTGQAPGVTDVLVSSGVPEDSLRVAVVAQSGFAMLLSTSADVVRIGAAAGSTLEVDLWMIRPAGGDGDLGSLQGTLQWDAAQLTYVSSVIVETGFSWFPNETDVGTGTLGFGTFSASGSARSFVLARVTFTVAGAVGGETPLTVTGTAAGNTIGIDILALIQRVISDVRIQ